VSHLKERKEKVCLNCKAELHGRYCHLCGQQNLEPKETVWHLVQHFFNDITHFDGSFFSTVKYLLRKPGFLSSEYIAGRRASYLNPIRMYVFTSAFFFIILFSLKKPEDMVRENPTKEAVTRRGLPALKEKKAREEKELAKTTDGDDKDELKTGISHLGMEIGVIQKRYGDTTTLKFDDKQLTGFRVEALTDSLQDAGLSPAAKRNISAAVKDLNSPGSETSLFGFNARGFTSVAQYDSSERALPDSLRDGWFGNWAMRKIIIIQEERTRDKQRFNERFMENMFHSFPKILFWSLPIFALILNVLYFRHRKYYYVDHGIFTIHVYIATFILMLVALLLNQLEKALNWGWFNVVGDILVFGVSLYMLIYLYKAMRGFYKQRRAKTFVKYFIVCSLSFFINLILLLIFFLISLISV
jgi:Protein of unknown function (DUF3667)